MPERPTSVVTGCAGFMGSHVADELLRMGHRVIGLDDLSGGSPDNVPRGVEFRAGSVADAALVDQLLQDRPHYVFHLAAYAAEGLSHFIKRFNYTNNLIGSVNLINAAVNAGSVKCFVFTSSAAVYGAGQLPMTEDLTPRPEDPYGIAKYAVELDLEESHRMFGLNYVIFRPHNVYGERQNLADPYRNVIGIFMRQALADEPMTIFGDGQQTRPFSYIGDVAPAIARSVERPESYGQVFNIGAERRATVLELARLVAGAMGVESKVVHLAPRNEVQHVFASHERVRRVFGDLIHDTPLEEGLARMAAWARRTGARRGKAFGELEVTKNLPPSWREV